MEMLPISAIRSDGGTQVRVNPPEGAVVEYADAMEAGAEFPPVVAFFDGKDYWLADGHLRLEAAQRAGREHVSADVREGHLRDAVLYACGANAEHGARRTNADKRNAIMRVLKDDAWRKRSNRWIADTCHVGHSCVDIIRKEMESAGKIRRETAVIARNGQRQTKSSDLRRAAKLKPRPQPIGPQREMGISEIEIRKCLTLVESALVRGNEEEAVLAVRRAFVAIRNQCEVA